MNSSSPSTSSKRSSKYSSHSIEGRMAYLKGVEVLTFDRIVEMPDIFVELIFHNVARNVDIRGEVGFAVGR